MRKILGWVIGTVFVAAIFAVWAADDDGMEGFFTPTVVSKPVIPTNVLKNPVVGEKTAVIRTYICPMDGYTSNKPGTCPRCGMNLVEKK